MIRGPRVSGNNTPEATDISIRHPRGAGKALLATAGLLAAGLVLWSAWALRFEDPLAPSDSVVLGNRAAVRTEVRTLDERLHDLLEDLVNVRDLEGEARLLAGLGPAPVDEAPGESGNFYPATCIDDLGLARSLVTSALHLENALQQAEQLKASYAQVLGGMESRADAWAAIPTIFPVDCARLTSDYGSRRDPITGRRSRHTGMDLAAPYGAPIRASADGFVARAGWMRGYGKIVELDHGNGILTRYAHNSKILVQRGETVRRGQIIGRLGATGRVNAPHLHYEVLVNGHRMNPRGHTLGLAD